MATNYYQNQMARLKDKTTISVQFNDYEGNKTNYMNLNLESVDVLINFLQAEKKRMQKEVKATEEDLKTVVVFKKEGTEVCAMMPYEIADRQGNITSYAHVGQHSAASLKYVKKLPNATPEEYEALKKELEAAGYTFKLIRSISTTKWAKAYEAMLQEE